MMRRRRQLAWMLALCATSACISPADPVVMRYFSPEPALMEAASKRSAEAQAQISSGSLRLRRLSAASHLQERWVWRQGAEYGFAEESRWTEPPIAYVERALARALFEERGLRRSEAAGAPFLDLELTAFDWLPGAEAGVQLAFSLRLGARSGSESLLEKSFEVTLPLPAGASDVQVSNVMGLGLQQLIDQAAETIVETLKQD